MRDPTDRSSPQTTTATPALETVGLAKRYGRRGVWALRDLDLTIPSGSITALVGPNGAGKSTLIRSFIGFERPTSGELRVCGIDPRQDRVGVIDQIGYVSQSSALYRGLSVGSNLKLARSLRKTFETDVAEARLKRFEIPMSQRVGTLSGGQQAQVMLSIALPVVACEFEMKTSGARLAIHIGAHSRSSPVW